MNVIEIQSFGAPSVLVPATRPEPVARAGELLIRVSASGINRPDVLQRTGNYPVPPGASDIPGLEVAGVVVSGDAVAYIAWVFVADGVFFAGGMLAWKGLAVLPRQRKAWGVGMIAAAASFGAYAVSVWAMTIAPIAVVAALRETSILFAVMIGWLVFGEKMTRGKALAALVIVGGVMLTRL